MNKKVCLIGPYPPPYGGMSIQLQMMSENLKKAGFNINVIKTNQDIFYLFKNLKGIRTIFNFILYIRALIKNIPSTDTVYIFAASNFYFLIIVVPAIFLSKFFKKEIFANFHGGGPQWFFGKFNYLVRFSLKQTKIIVPSGYLQKIIKDYLDLESLIVPNIVNLNQFHFKERNPIQPYLLCTRHFEPIYNLCCVIKAFKIITDSLPDAKLGLVGIGSDKAKIEKLVEELAIKDRVKFYGKLPYEKLPEIYDQYDIFINASNVDNSPCSIIEAFASGLPVVSTNPGGIPYLVDNGKTGLLVNLNDCNALAQKIIYLYKNPFFTLNMAKKARVECEKHDWEKVKTKVKQLLFF